MKVAIGNILNVISNRIKVFYSLKPRTLIFLLLISFAAILIIMRFGVAEKSDAVTSSRAKAVEVVKTAESQYPSSLDYVGTVESEELVKYSFKTAGQIKKIYVSEGDEVKEGQILAELDSTDLNFQQAASRDTANVAAASISKAQDALNYANNLYEKANELYAEGAVSKDYFDQVELKRNAAEADYRQAVAQHSAASTDYQYQADLLSNSVLYAEQDGYIAQKISNEFERVGAYTPVLVLRSGKQIVNIGVPQQELSRVRLDSEVTIDVDGNTASGTITKISELPDAATRTYNAEVTINTDAVLADKQFPLGAIAKVSVETGYVKGIWIPFSSLFSDDGENCIYVVKDGRALKRTVEIQNMRDDQVMVRGLSIDELLVTSGMNNLNDGTEVSIPNQE